MEEFLGPQADYNEEEEEKKYYRRKRLGIIKNVVAASIGAMIVYSVYMGEFPWRWGAETGKHRQGSLNIREHLLYLYMCATGLLQMQLILHYDTTYREVKYSNLGLQDIDQKMLMGINVTPIIGLLYTPLLIR